MDKLIFCMLMQVHESLKLDDFRMSVHGTLKYDVSQ